MHAALDTVRSSAIVAAFLFTLAVSQSAAIAEAPEAKLKLSEGISMERAADGPATASISFFCIKGDSADTYGDLLLTLKVHYPKTTIQSSVILDYPGIEKTKAALIQARKWLDSIRERKLNGSKNVGDVPAQIGGKVSISVSSSTDPNTGKFDAAIYLELSEKMDPEAPLKGSPIGVLSDKECGKIIEELSSAEQFLTRKREDQLEFDAALEKAPEKNSRGTPVRE